MTYISNHNHYNKASGRIRLYNNPKKINYEKSHKKTLQVIPKIIEKEIRNKIELPLMSDIYEGLRCFYPSLYDEAAHEVQMIHNRFVEEEQTYEDYEMAWEQYEYIMYLSD